MERLFPPRAPSTQARTRVYTHAHIFTRTHSRVPPQLRFGDFLSNVVERTERTWRCKTADRASVQDTGKPPKALPRQVNGGVFIPGRRDPRKVGDTLSPETSEQGEKEGAQEAGSWENPGWYLWGFVA
jgi:hypothetical protein